MNYSRCKPIFRTKLFHCSDGPCGAKDVIAVVNSCQSLDHLAHGSWLCLPPVSHIGVLVVLVLVVPVVLVLVVLVDLMVLVFCCVQ